MSNELTITDLHPSVDDITGDVLRGLSATPKRLPSKYFYDKRGSELFEAITCQPEYYPTRVELAMLADHGPRIAAAVGPRAHVVEYGSGSGRKTRLLLDALEDPVAYTPIEISRSALTASAQRLDREFGDVEVLPVLADFTQAVPLPSPSRSAGTASAATSRWCRCGSNSAGPCGCPRRSEAPGRRGCSSRARRRAP